MLGSKLSYGTKFAVVSEITWVCSEFDGKHQGCKFWSENVIDSGLKNKGLVHEHLIPKKIIIDKLVELNKPKPIDIQSILDIYCIGVVVTKEEDSC